MDVTPKFKNVINRKEREIWLACDALTRQQQSLTYLAIAEELVRMGYKRGSNSDIRRYLNTWRKNEHEVKHDVKAETPTFVEQLTASNVLTPAPALSAEEFAHLEREYAEKMLRLTQHYMDQFQRLIDVVEGLKQENHILRQKYFEKVERHNHDKPRLKCKID